MKHYVRSIDWKGVKEFESDTIEDCIQWCEDQLEEIDSYGTPRTWDQMGSINFYNQEIERLTVNYLSPELVKGYKEKIK